MMVTVRGRNDLDHEVNGQCGDGHQGRAQEKFHFHQQPAIGSLARLITAKTLARIGITKSYESLGKRMATVKRLVNEIFR